MEPEPQAASCVACQKPAKKRCIGCKDHPDPHGIIGSIWYCSTDCQTAHWKEHKKDCKLRKDRLALFRIGDILQEMFYIYREVMFDTTIIRVEEIRGKLYVFEGAHPQETSAVDYLKPFPEHLPMSREDKNATLTRMACTDALMWMHEMVAYLLSDLTTELKELSVDLKGVKRWTVLKHIDGVGQDVQQVCDHVLTQVDMRDGLSYALDMSGAQFGWSEPILTLDHFLKNRVEGIRISSPFGSTVSKVDKIIQRTHGMMTDIHKNNKQAAPVLKQATIAWEVNQTMTVREMYRLEMVEYEAKKEDLLGDLRNALTGWLRDYRQQ